MLMDKKDVENGKEVTIRSFEYGEEHAEPYSYSSSSWGVTPRRYQGVRRLRPFDVALEISGMEYNISATEEITGTSYNRQPLNFLPCEVEALRRAIGEPIQMQAIEPEDLKEPYILLTLINIAIKLLKRGEDSSMVL